MIYMHLLLFVWPPTCIDLHWLWSSSYLYASRQKIFTVWPPSASQDKLITSFCICDIYGFMWLERTCERTCESIWPPITSLYTVLVLHTCMDLHVRLARALLGVESVSLKHCLTIFVRCQIVCRQGNKDLLLRWLRAKPGNEWMNEWMFVLSSIANTLNKDIS